MSLRGPLVYSRLGLKAVSRTTFIHVEAKDLAHCSCLIDLSTAIDTYEVMWTK